MATPLSSAMLLSHKSRPRNACRPRRFCIVLTAWNNGKAAIRNNKRYKEGSRDSAFVAESRVRGSRRHEARQSLRETGGRTTDRSQ